MQLLIMILIETLKAKQKLSCTLAISFFRFVANEVVSHNLTLCKSTVINLIAIERTPKMRKYLHYYRTTFHLYIFYSGMARFTTELLKFSLL